MMDGEQLSRRREITEEDYQRLHPKLVGLFRRKGASPEDARDLTQDTLLEAHKSLANFDRHSALDTWVISIAKNLWLHHLRDRGRLKRSAEEVPLDADTTSRRDVPTVAGHENQVIDRDRLARLGKLVAKLPDAMRQALVLQAKGHKYKHIATLLGVNVNQVSSLIHQARTKLRRDSR